MQKQTPIQSELPDKFYFKIGEVSELSGIPPYVLRFWESEFRQLKPKRTGSGQRLYRKIDVETVLKIKDLLYDRKFTIKGARNKLNKKTSKSVKPTYGEIRRELQTIRKLLKK